MQCLLQQYQDHMSKARIHRRLAAKCKDFAQKEYFLRWARNHEKQARLLMQLMRNNVIDFDPFCINDEDDLTNNN